MRDYTALLEAGNKAQREKLGQNWYKEGFDDIDIEYATNRIKDEFEELTNEIWIISYAMGCTNYWHKENKDYKKIRHEAADIANFAHMIILACDKELEK